MGATHPGEDRWLYGLVVATLALIFAMAWKSRKAWDITFLLALYRSALLASSLLLPEGVRVVSYLAGTWWVPFLFFLVANLRGDEKTGALASGGLPGPVLLALMLGFPPFSGGLAMVAASHALAWPLSSDLLLWAAPLVALGAVSFRVPSQSGGAGFQRVVAAVSVAVEAFRIHVLLGTVALVLGAMGLLMGRVFLKNDVFRKVGDP